jgi:hypothetical protein
MELLMNLGRERERQGVQLHGLRVGEIEERLKKLHTLLDAAGMLDMVVVNKGHAEEISC